MTCPRSLDTLLPLITNITALICIFFFLEKGIFIVSSQNCLSSLPQQPWQQAQEADTLSMRL